jgi:hypothetical protein
VVIDSHDVRAAPGPALQALCAAIDLPFDAAMLSWPAGGCADDGVWAAHWYDAVHRSTGFAGAEGPLPDLPPDLQALCARTLPIYHAMRAHALRPTSETTDDR